ncbi:MAG: helix-turn-helix transcriptional regulator [Oscillospiraceae bacterium]|nr:helix-turn-helix transcriptional regulator [Oscillospiraceae bacterium]
MENLGAFLSALRKERGLTQEELGVQLGVSNKTVSRWENNRSEPDLAMLQRLSAFYGVTAQELLAGKRLDTPAPSREPWESNFSVEEQKTYWKRKWLKEHLALLVIAVCLLDALFLTARKLRPLLPILAVVVYGVLRNRMMIYVEDHVYK